MPWPALVLYLETLKTISYLCFGAFDRLHYQPVPKPAASKHEHNIPGGTLGNEVMESDIENRYPI